MLLPVWLASHDASPQAGWSLRGAAPGVDRADLDEILVWLPSPGAFAAAGSGRVELLFHPLPSGGFHIARAVPARGKQDGFIHGFVVSPDAFVRCGSNPFTVLRQAHSAGGWADEAHGEPRLDPLPLPAHPATVDQILLARLAQEPGPARLATLLQAALDSVCLAIRAEPHATHLIAGLLNCLPPECRGEFSFSTLPVLSPQRPYRLVGGARWPEAPTELSARYNIETVDFTADAEPIWRPLDAWPRLIQRCLASGYTAFLLRQFHVARPELQWSDLSALGLQPLEEFDARVVSDDEEAGAQEHRPDRVLRLRHAHARFDAGISCPVKRPPAPSKNLDPDSPVVLERLELLDDVVFEAMGGNPQALARLEKLWPQVRADLGEELLEESREQYLRYALALWDEYASFGGLRSPSRVDAAIEVLCVLLSSPLGS